MNFIYHINQELSVLKGEMIQTPVGSMVAVADEYGLYALEFMERYESKRSTDPFYLKIKDLVMEGGNPITESIKKELGLYFSGKLEVFQTPLYLLGTEFQKMVWMELVKIPYGATRSYLEQAKILGKPKSYRAVGNANGVNRLMIVIPCHRVVHRQGPLAGYSSGIHRKKWLIDHEKKYRILSRS